jgi:4-cresol dehydrogenase (hydroxylating)
MADIERALAGWREALGPQGVLTDAASLAPYLANAAGLRRDVPAVLRPSSRSRVAEIVRVAAAARVPLYPVSTGNNWGYGSALPVRDGCAIVDLSGLAGIRIVDAPAGVVELEPGVTQRGLRAFLDAEGLPFLVPVTGAGPDCSIVGNALERGYGITPYADHFAAVTAVEAVLPDGTVYRPALTELGGERVDGAFKWGFGPYLDGLFPQGGLGIVTRLTVVLAPQPERVSGFFFGVRHDAELEQAAVCVRDALRRVGGIGGSINLMNRRRVLAMMAPYPRDRIGADGLVTDEHLDRLARENQVMAWTGAGALYGTRRLVAAARAEIRAALRPVARRLVFFSPDGPRRLAALAGLVPGALGVRARAIFGTLDKTMQLLAGAPSEIALPLAYWRSGTPPPAGQPMNPARDGCGLLWYSPLVPLDPATARGYVDMVERVCRAHRIEPLITLTSLSDRCWDSTVPILFDRADPAERDRAWACHRALLAAGRAAGCLPYRTNVDSMGDFVRPDTPYWRLVAGIKGAVDPHGIIAPGRYAP